MLRLAIKMDNSPDLEDEYGLNRWGQGGGLKLIHQDSLLNTRRRRGGGGGESKGRNGRFGFSFNKVN